VRFAVEASRRYLGCGGPTSRLESQLVLLGQKLGMTTDVFATPTGVFVTGTHQDTGEVLTLVGRIKVSVMDLSELQRIETLFEKLKRKDIDLVDGFAELCTDKATPTTTLPIFL